MEIIGLSILRHPMIHSKASRENPRVRPSDLLNWYTSILKAFVGNFQELTLLRVHISGFHVVDAEEAVFEFSQILMDEIAATHAHATDLFSSFGVMEGIDVPALWWHIALTGSLLQQQIP